MSRRAAVVERTTRHRVDYSDIANLTLPFNMGEGQAVRRCECGVLILGPRDTVDSSFLVHVLAGYGLG